mmetsp:Transcript_54288/g.152507  ORF Transcript_54288/g.152507 Transcript_54288/m.152507 type:complete len:258 (-) Transcript_54288:314-1087(-)
MPPTSRPPTAPRRAAPATWTCRPWMRWTSPSTRPAVGLGASRARKPAARRVGCRQPMLSRWPPCCSQRALAPRPRRVRSTCSRVAMSTFSRGTTRVGRCAGRKATRLPKVGCPMLALAIIRGTRPPKSTGWCSTGSRDWRTIRRPSRRPSASSGYKARSVATMCKDCTTRSWHWSRSTRASAVLCRCMPPLTNRRRWRSRRPQLQKSSGSLRKTRRLGWSSQLGSWRASGATGSPRCRRSGCGCASRRSASRDARSS